MIVCPYYISSKGGEVMAKEKVKKQYLNGYERILKKLTI